MRKLAITFICAAAINAAAQISRSNPVSIQVDLTKAEGPYTPIYSWFGYDESNYTTMKYGKQLLTELHDLSPVPVYIRAHHLLTSGNGVAELKWSSSNVFTLDANGKPVYDFTIMDQIFDRVSNSGCAADGRIGLHAERSCCDSARSDRVSGSLSGQHHLRCIQQSSEGLCRCGESWCGRSLSTSSNVTARRRCSTWYFEVWNEPDIDYWHGTPEEYWKLYDYAVAGVRAALPGAIVGGPASTGPASRKQMLFSITF